jgi:hypothetical protein
VARPQGILLPIIITALVAALLGGAGVWVAWARTVPTKDEVQEMIKTQSPYVYEQQLIRFQLEELKKDKLKVLVLEVLEDSRYER